jgi:hypothetical protein
MAKKMVGIRSVTSAIRSTISTSNITSSAIPTLLQVDTQVYVTALGVISNPNVVIRVVTRQAQGRGRGPSPGRPTKL